MPLKLRVFRNTTSVWRARPARTRAVFTASTPAAYGSNAAPKALRAWWVWRQVVGRVTRRVTLKQRMLCFHSQGGRCNECKLPLPKAFEVDHILPKWAGGVSEQSNLQALDKHCHSKKTKAQDPYKLLRDLLKQGTITHDVITSMARSPPPAGALLAASPAVAGSREIISSENQVGRAASFAAKPEKQLSKHSPSRALRGFAIKLLTVATGSDRGSGGHVTGPCTGC